jgi:hypothetical protein
MLIAALLAGAGLLLLSLAADHLVLGSSRIATRPRISPVVVGVVVVGLGTSAPELLVSGVAAARGDVGIAVGNIVGSPDWRRRNWPDSPDAPATSSPRSRRSPARRRPTSWRSGRTTRTSTC